ncbi:MAG: MFS transporter [Vulcanimicrobiota bacterium]
MNARLNLFVVASVSFCLLITNLDISIVNILLPTLTRTFHIDTFESSRVILLYVLAMAGFLPVFGKIGDIKGSKTIFIGGYAVFTAASLFCSLSQTFLQLEISRFIQGIGAAMLLSNFAAIIVKCVPETMRGRVFGISSVFCGVGIAMGPPLSGYIIQNYHWSWIFLINIPLGIIAIITSSIFLPMREGASSDFKGFDYKGAVLITSALIVLFHFLNTGSKRGWINLHSLLILSSIVILLYLFVKIENKADDPVIDISYFNKLPLVYSLISTFLVVMISDGLYFVFPYYFEFGRSFSPQQVGCLLMCSSFTTMIAGPLAGYISDRFKPGLVVRVAVLLLLIDCVLFFYLKNSESIVYMIASFLLLGLSLAAFFSTNACLIFSYARKGKEGMLSAISSVNSYVATILGVSFFEVAFSSSFSLQDLNLSSRNLLFSKINTGYQYSAILAVVLCVIAVITSIKSKECKSHAYD